MATRLEVLIVSADLETLRTLSNVLSQWALEPICCSTVSEAQAALSEQVVPLVFCEDHLADGSFREVLRAAEFAGPRVRVVVTTRNGCRNEAFRLGAFNVISCPCQISDVQQTIFRAMQKADPVCQNAPGSITAESNSIPPAQSPASISPCLFAE